MFLVRNIHYFRLDDFGSHATLFTGCKNLSNLILFIYVLMFSENLREKLIFTVRYF